MYLNTFLIACVLLVNIILYMLLNKKINLEKNDKKKFLQLT